MKRTRKNRGGAKANEPTMQLQTRNSPFDKGYPLDEKIEQKLVKPLYQPVMYKTREPITVVPTQNVITYELNQTSASKRNIPKEIIQEPITIETEEINKTPDTWNVKSVITKLEEFAIEGALIESDKLDEYTNDLITTNAIENNTHSLVSKIILNSTSFISSLEDVVDSELNAIKVTIQLLIDTYFSRMDKPFVGGHGEPYLNEHLVTALMVGKYDSAHDFKPSKRNKIFPSILESLGMSKPGGLAVVDMLNHILPTPPVSALETKLNKYVTNSPLQFEEDVKVDYLLEELVGALHDVTYYFKPKEGVLPERWSDDRKTWFTKPGHEYQSIKSLYADMRKNDIEYWVFDACMSSKVKNRITAERLLTIANIWDPSKNGVVTKEELGESTLIKTTDALTWSPVPPSPGFTRPTGYIVEDYVFTENDKRESVYDIVYNILLNDDELTISRHFNISIRLYTFNDICGVALIINYNYPPKNESIEIYLSSGFSVNELSHGMRYIETGSQTDLNDNLKKIIDFLHEHYSSGKELHLEPDNIKYQYYKLLLRFKASGDHGQAELVKFINERLKKNTVFVTGDNLAYVYSIARLIPTISVYYRVSSRGDKEEEEEDDPDAGEDDDDTDKKPQFIVGYFPMADTVEKYNKKFIELSKVILSLYEDYKDEEIQQKLSEQPVELDEPLVERLFTELDGYVTQNEIFIESLKQKRPTYQGDPSTPVRFPNVDAEINVRMKSILSTLNYNFIISIPKLFETKNTIFGDITNDVKQNKPIFSKIKEYVFKLSDFINSCYFIKNYKLISTYIFENIKDTLGLLHKVSPDIDALYVFTNLSNEYEAKLALAREARSADKLTVNTNFINATFKPDFKGTLEDYLKKASDNVSTGFTLLRKMTDIYNQLLKNKRKMAKLISNHLKLDKASFDAIINRIESIRLVYIAKMIDQISTIPNHGPFLATYFKECFYTSTIGAEELNTLLRSDKETDSLVIAYESRIEALKKETIMEETKKKLDGAVSNRDKTVTTIRNLQVKIDDPAEMDSLEKNTKMLATKNKTLVNQEEIIAEKQEMYDEAKADYDVSNAKAMDDESKLDLSILKYRRVLKLKMSVITDEKTEYEKYRKNEITIDELLDKFDLNLTHESLQKDTSILEYEIDDKLSTTAALKMVEHIEGLSLTESEFTDHKTFTIDPLGVSHTPTGTPSSFSSIIVDAVTMFVDTESSTLFVSEPADGLESKLEEAKIKYDEVVAEEKSEVSSESSQDATTVANESIGSPRFNDSQSSIDSQYSVGSQYNESDPDTEPVIEPKAEPVIEPKAEPVAEPKAEPVAEPTVGLITKPVDLTEENYEQYKKNSKIKRQTFNETFGKNVTPARWKLIPDVSKFNDIEKLGGQMTRRKKKTLRKRPTNRKRKTLRK